MGGTIACVAGIAALFLLQTRFGFCVWRSQVGPRGWMTAMGWALPFMVAATIADLLWTFPANINVRLPMALIFYPPMGFVAQMSLHVIPFVLALWAATRVFRAWPENYRIWLCMLLAALPEAAFQASDPFSGGGDPLALRLFVSAQLLIFGVAEIQLFRRFDFAAMYLFRLTYYAYWHILWASLRV